MNDKKWEKNVRKNLYQHRDCLHLVCVICLIDEEMDIHSWILNQEYNWNINNQLFSSYKFFRHCVLFRTI